MIAYDCVKLLNHDSHLCQKNFLLTNVGLVIVFVEPLIDLLTVYCGLQTRQNRLPLTLRDYGHMIILHSFILNKKLIANSYFYTIYHTEHLTIETSAY